MNKTCKKFVILSCVELAAAFIFSFFSLSFSLDISLISFPLALVYTALLSFLTYSAVKNKDGKKILPVLKMTQYLPYFLLICFILRRYGKNGTPYFIDVITVLMWFVTFFLAFFVSSLIDEKKVKLVCEGWKIAPVVGKKPKGGMRVLYEAVDWIDSIIWAIFTVLIVQIFVFQLYEIPSESMVPTFLIKDKVIVSKFDCGPKFPLTDVGLPDFRTYKRGDTIVLRNPHYSIDRKSEAKSVTSQLVSMLTFMQVNLNKDSNGELKADPLVKRITGLPGEQLVMQDGTLYSRTKNSDSFEPVQTDSKYAAWNLGAIDSKATKQKIVTYPLSEEVFDRNRSNLSEVVKSSNENYEKMLAFEEERRNFDLNVAEIQARDLVSQFNKLAYTSNLSGNFSQDSLFEYDLFNNVQEITARLMNQNGGTKWFEDFMTSWIISKDEKRDLYAESNYKLDVMTKIYFGNLVVRHAQLLKTSSNSYAWLSDSIIDEYIKKAQTVHWYVQDLLDERNMPVFPANDEENNPQYIPDDCYFMMGDNRFNSLDLRHSYERNLTALTSGDSMSVTYYSMMAPQYINKKLIIGKPIYRFWPASRKGRV